ncbi:Heat shock 70 kDa protein cognate 4 [Orchesella cincta]|uniref:Heat shock 70 kDa protein cognate 4 n=1 Tax=Orchesella cincta TaxID=48709 RepID=A0A1D2M289_ORCCI|nr:Heat shock 70 kDa protein cognate 4 [Orchesella cincta]
MTIKNDKGKEEIERMIADAEKYKKEDEMQQGRIKAKNQLEAYLFGVKQTVQEVLDKCNDNLKWLDSNALAEKEEYEDRLKEMEKECQHDEDAWCWWCSTWRSWIPWWRIPTKRWTFSCGTRLKNTVLCCWCW